MKSKTQKTLRRMGTKTRGIARTLGRRLSSETEKVVKSVRKGMKKDFINKIG